MDAWQVAYAAMFCITALHAVVAITWLIVRRHKHPIRGHSLLLTLSCIVTICVLTLTTCAANMDLGVSCTALLVGYNIKVANTAYYIARVIRMFVLYTTQQEKGSYGLLITYIPELAIFGPAEKPAPYLSMRLSRLLGKVTDLKLFVAATCLALALIVCLDIPYFMAGRFDGVFIPSTGFDWEPCEELDSSVTYFTILVGIGILIFIVLAFFLRDVHDGFMIKAEFYRIVATAFAILVVGALPGRIQRQREVMWMIVLVENIILYWTGLWKIWLSYLYSYSAAKSAARKSGSMSRTRRKYTLLEVLNIPEKRQLFKEHLQREWSVENLMFYDAVNQFRDLWDNGTLDTDTKRLSTVSYIVETYIEDGSPSCVNISFEVRNNVLSAFKEGAFSRDMFDAAQRGVFRLMHRDSFTRFAHKYGYDHGDQLERSEVVRTQTLTVSDSKTVSNARVSLAVVTER